LNEETLLVTIEFTCPSCTTALKAPDAYAGKLAKCKKCQARVVIPANQEIGLELDLGNPPQLAGGQIGQDFRQELKNLGFPDLKSISLRNLSEEDVKSIFDWGIRTFQLGSSEQGTIDEIKYDGHLVVLDDGSRWEVDDGDTYTTDGWCEGDEVVVINGRMYRLDELESVEVTKE
jgi:hypothetical protein